MPDEETKPKNEGDLTGGHDPAALEEAEKKMLVRDNTEVDERHANPDPPGGHDPAALEEAEERMLLRDDIGKGD